MRMLGISLRKMYIKKKKEYWLYKNEKNDFLRGYILGIERKEDVECFLMEVCQPPSKKSVQRIFD